MAGLGRRRHRLSSETPTDLEVLFRCFCSRASFNGLGELKQLAKLRRNGHQIPHHIALWEKNGIAAEYGAE